MTKIFLGGFPLEITELSLVQLLSYHGEVATIKIVRNKQTRICKGYAFIETASLNDATKIIKALDGTMLAERELTLKLVEEKPIIVEEIKPIRKISSPTERFTNRVVVVDSAATRTKRPRIKI
nr:RNA-binding protein [uncultured Mucilaginibacter sp.]